MKPQHDFVAERAVAQHCDELFAKAPSSDDEALELDVFAKRLVRLLKADLAPQLGGDGLGVAIEDVGKRKATSLFKAIGPAAANVFIKCGEYNVPLVLSFDYGAALALTEQAFGGEVRQVEVELSELPRSAWLVLESMASQIAKTFANAAEWKGPVSVQRMHENIRKLDAFTKNAPCLVWPTILTLPSGVELPFRIVTEEAEFHEATAAPGTSSPSKPNGGDGPTAGVQMFGELPLPLNAVLAELTMPVSRLACLKPGDCIPFTPRREVPLLMGPTAIARGQIGALDDQVALNLTQLP